MSSSSDQTPPAGEPPGHPEGRANVAATRREAIIARARELLADPGYPTEAIIRELAAMMARESIVPEPEDWES